MAVQNPYPFFLALNVVLTANQTSDITFLVPAQQRLRIKKWYWTSTGAFSLLDVRTATNIRYINANASQPLLSTHLPAPTSSNLSNQLPDTLELVIEPNQSVAFTVLDTSGAGNTIRLSLLTMLENPAIGA